ncbi:solute carrier family 35 member C2 isoform X2 [Phlebotomus papatasi]|uniref:solute carrier family 35 member C2 isoform X2 n=1 Tax=Phlebotomus papatasi TaxID=29031 RepID=UPI0024839DF1|nr:solute carrier family 35 member C2 isoform X2 [Phlebotomus papatasi]
MKETRYERLQAADQGDTEVENVAQSVPEVNLETKTMSGNELVPIGRMTLAQRALFTLCLILMYFALSIGLTFYQRSLLQSFKFPLSVVLYHLLIKLLLSGLIRCVYRLVTGRSRVVLSCRNLFKIVPTGIASGLDIGFSNWGLELVNISLYTMAKSTTIVFILIFGILLGLEKRSWSLVAIVVLISGGLFMFTYKSTHFDALGFMFLLIASLSSGIRWSFAQLLMQKSKLGLHNPIDMIYYMQPWMLVAIVPVTLGFEGRKILEEWPSVAAAPASEVVLMWMKVTVGAVVAFAMEFSEFLVLSFTSSLTLSVAGIFKEICQIVLAVEANGDQLSLHNVLGLALCLAGICCHVAHKYWIFSTNAQIPSQTEGKVAYEAETQLATASTSTGETSRQQIPLLDTDVESTDDSDEPVMRERRTSEVIFDVLKRRDPRRKIEIIQCRTSYGNFCGLFHIFVHFLCPSPGQMKENC